METAHFLLEEGKEITILEMLKRVGQDMSPKARKMVLETLVQNGVEILTEAKALSVEQGNVVFNRGGVLDRIIGVDSIVIAVGIAPQEIGSLDLERLAIPIRRVGDASVPRKLFDAIHEGFNVAIEI